MAVYSRILVPLDGTPVDGAVLDHVAPLAALTGAEVVLLRVAHYHTRDTMTHEIDDAEEVLERARARLEGGGFPVRGVVGRGEPADVIIEQAHALGCDLIAMATHGHGALKRAVLGSVAEKVRHTSVVPLLLVKAAAGDGPDEERE